MTIEVGVFEEVIGVGCVKNLHPLMSLVCVKRVERRWWLVEQGISLKMVPRQ